MVVDTAFHQKSSVQVQDAEEKLRDTERRSAVSETMVPSLVAKDVIHYAMINSGAHQIYLLRHGYRREY